MTTDNAAERILAALKAMPERERHVLILVRFESWSLARVAYALGMETHEAETAFCKALVALDEALASEGDGDA